MTRLHRHLHPCQDGALGKSLAVKGTGLTRYMHAYVDSGKVRSRGLHRYGRQDPCLARLLVFRASANASCSGFPKMLLLMVEKSANFSL